jgi:hypothetical protein
MVTGARRMLAGLALVVLAGIIACKAREQEFYATIYPCQLGAAVDPCGTTQDGKPMVCYAGSQLGGTDFCTEKCDPANPPSDPTVKCLTSGALLRVCHPHGSQDYPALGCPDKLSCYRTDLLSDDGVCLMMPVCTNDSDCKDPSRSACAASIIRALLPPADVAASPMSTSADAGSPSGLPVDHLQCVKPLCKSGGSNCAANEACLADFFARGPAVPDICIPSCDGDNHCPPNYACGVGPDAPGAPRVCVPGLPGQRCHADQDCIAGTCFDTGAGFNECVLPLSCKADQDCASLGSGQAVFTCVEGRPGAGRRCIALTPFDGSNCETSADCASSEECYQYSPYVLTMGHGECRIPCDKDNPCPVRGGVPQVCLDQGQGGCYPGLLGLPCTSDAGCLPSLKCLSASPDARSLITDPMICTKECTTDADCRADPVISTHGFCKQEPDGTGRCRLTGDSGEPCDADDQCSKGICLLDGSGGGQCA